ncbi:MAG: class I SAM-dependent methyltransferase, partial [Actinobacteria bacterium]|nr:class I SAM-dependent methyltransferase [Actinomycetota bacterium]
MVSDNPFGLHGYTPSSYGDAFADVYDEWYRTLGDHDLVDALTRHLPPRPADVLELGVGTGRLLDRLVTARTGTTDRLTGVDTSGAMIDRAREVPSLANAELVIGDFSESLPGGEYDLVFCGYNTFFNLA